MNLFARFSDFFVAPSVSEINRRAAAKALADERAFWRAELRKAERRVHECRDELDKLDEMEACRGH